MKFISILFIADVSTYVKTFNIFTNIKRKSPIKSHLNLINVCFEHVIINKLNIYFNITAAKLHDIIVNFIFDNR